MHEGSITFSTALDNTQLEKELSELTKKIAKKEREIADLTSKRDAGREKSLFNAAALDAEKAKLQELQARVADIRAMSKDKGLSFGERDSAKAFLPALQEELDGQRTRVNAMRADWNRLENSIDRYDQALKSAGADLERQKEEAGSLQQQINDADRARAEALSSAQVADQRMVDLNRELLKLKVRQAELEQMGLGLGHEEYDQVTARMGELNGELKEYRKNLSHAADGAEVAAKGTEKISEASKRAGGYMNNFGKRLKGVLASAFIFNILSSGLRQFTAWAGKSVRANDEARAAIARLKGALLTLAQPLVEVVIPAFTLLVNVLAQIVTAVAQFVSMLFGKTLKQSKDGAKSLYKEANAIGAVGAAADEAAGSLAGFDEINPISTEGAKGAGGSGGAGEIVPDFGNIGTPQFLQDILDMLERVAPLVAMIGTGFALWKIGEMLPGVLGQIATLLGGILMTVGGILVFWDGVRDAWENGVNWGNLIEMIGGLAAAAFGLYTIFELLHPGWGKIAAGIALVVGGIAMLVTGFHDAMENGWNLQNLLLSIAGLLAAGLGISLLTGSWIPLLIAGIASILLALTVATGHGEELLNGIREVIEGFRDFFVGVFTGDMEKAIGGIGKIFEGLKKTVFAVIDGVKDTFLSFLNWLDEKTGGKFHGIIELAKGLISGFFDNVKTTIGGWIDGVKKAFEGVIKFLSGVFTQDWDMAWDGVKDIFAGVWNSMISLLEGAVNLIIRGLNWLIRQMNKIKFDVPDWVPGVGGKSIGINIPPISELKIPRLAQGAVIPPNREFMAVLGDQRHGTNLEAPEDLIRKIVREEAGGGGETTALLQAILSAIKDGHIIMVDGSVFGRTAIKTINSVNTSAGKQLLLI